MSLDVENLIPQNELARFLKVTPKTIREWSLRGVNGRKLERVVLGGKVYYQRAAVEAFRTPVEPVKRKRIVKGSDKAAREYLRGLGHDV